MSTPAAAVTAQIPTPAGSAAAPAPSAWYQSDSFKDLPADTHEWLGKYKSPTDALIGGFNAQKFIGVPPERVLKLPEKPDAPEWGEIRARVGWKAPEKPEDYGIAAPEGYPPEYAAGMAAAAHKLGIPKDALLQLAAENDKAIQAFQQQRDQTIRTRLDAADAGLKKALGEKHGETMELVQREMSRLGLSPEAVEAVETSLALSDDKGVAAFRQALVDLALARREAPLHNGATTMQRPDAQQAQTRLSELATDPAWAAKALERGTPEAKERIRLNILASGGVPNEDEVSRLANAVYGTV